MGLISGLLSGLVRRAQQVRAGREDGRAIVEFVFLGVLVFVPIVYLIVTLGLIQRASFAAATAAREAGRVFVTSTSDAQARDRAGMAATLAFDDYGVAGGTLTVTCDGSPCLRPEGRVEMTARVTVGLPLVPDFFSGIMPTSVPVEATHEVTVDRFRAGG